MLIPVIGLWFKVHVPLESKISNIQLHCTCSGLYDLHNLRPFHLYITTRSSLQQIITCLLGVIMYWFPKGIGITPTISLILITRRPICFHRQRSEHDTWCLTKLHNNTLPHLTLALISLGTGLSAVYRTSFAWIITNADQWSQWYFIYLIRTLRGPVGLDDASWVSLCVMGDELTFDRHPMLRKLFPNEWCS